MDISVITVTYNSAPFVADWARSIQAQEGVCAEIIVVDNASSDNTVQVIRELRMPAQLLANHNNIGFGRACNQAFAISRGRLAFLLNPDAQLEQRDGLTRLREALDKHPCWGLAGTLITRPDGHTEAHGQITYPEQHRVGCDFSQLPGSLAWVGGASMIIRREVFAAVGGFDPGFFLSSEETDLCLRVRQHGMEIGFVADVSVRHVGMASERGQDPYQTWLVRMGGLLRFWSKHYPAKDVCRLVWRDLFRASLRQRWYAIFACLNGPTSTAWHKYRRYGGIRAACRQFLNTKA
jgi:GT2 family glycosyltransferase